MSIELPIFGWTSEVQHLSNAPESSKWRPPAESPPECEQTDPSERRDGQRSPIPGEFRILNGWMSPRPQGRGRPVPSGSVSRGITDPGGLYVSIKSMAYTEVERDMKDPTDKKNDPNKPTSESLIDAIPGEVLAPYTAILAVIVANAKASEWEVGRWIMYGIGLVVVPLAVYMVWRREKDTKATRRAPIAGMVGSTIAFGAWGLVMPGAPLGYTVTSQSSLTIWTFIIVTVAGGAIAWLPLTRQVAKSTGGARKRAGSVG